MPTFVTPYGKRLLFLGLVLLVIGLSVLSARFFLPSSETLISTSVDTTGTNSYFSDKFRAEAGDWLEVDMASSGGSVLHVNGQSVGEIFNLAGTVYKYQVTISKGDVYQVEVENKVGHWNWWVWEADNNHVSGNFYVRRTPPYLSVLTLTGGVLLVIGSIVIPSVVFLEYTSRQQAKLLSNCPRCGKQIQISLSTCPYCKLELSKYWVRCKYCNKFYDSHLEKCPKCGAEA